MGLLPSRSSTSPSVGVATSVDVDMNGTDSVLKAARKEVNARTKVGMKRAADIAVEPAARAAAAATMPPIASAAVVTKATTRKAVVTTRGPKQLDRIVGLLEFGGTVSAPIVAKGSGRTGLPIASGVIRYSVHGDRHYTGKGALRAAVASRVDQFESILLDEIIQAFDPIPHTPA